MDYPCAKFGDLRYSRFGFIVRTTRHTDTETESHTDVAKRFNLVTVVSVRLA